MSNRFEWDDTNSSGIWWSTNVSIRDECILLKAFYNFFKNVNFYGK